MKKSAKILCTVLCLVMVLSLLAACGSKKQETSEAMPTPIIIYVTPEPTATPAAASAEPTAVPAMAETSPAPGAAETQAPAGSPTPAPAATSTPAPTARASAPTVTKSPTDERLTEGGTCLFVARADNASSIVWHLVSPDGNTDITYDAAKSRFPSLGISGGTENTLRLSNVPASMNGWKVYCRFGNSVGSVSSGSAVISVTAAATPAPTQAPPAPTQAPAPEPASEPNISGTYHDSIAGRATMTISGSPDYYTVNVYWSGSAFEHAEWTFSGSASDGRLSYNNAVKTVVSYDEDGIETRVTEYTNGSGALYYGISGGLRWEDFEENIASGTAFVQ